MGSMVVEGVGWGVRRVWTMAGLGCLQHLGHCCWYWLALFPMLLLRFLLLLLLPGSGVCVVA